MFVLVWTVCTKRGRVTVVAALEPNLLKQLKLLFVSEALLAAQSEQHSVYWQPSKVGRELANLFTAGRKAPGRPVNFQVVDNTALLSWDQSII